VKPQPGKFLIGLTGNIATGKSIVRKMLEQAGVFGIDADSLAHYVIKAGASGYKPVLEQFGEGILNSIGEIDRRRLGKIVFNDPESLQKLENIIHPLVREKIHELLETTPFSHIVIEAIKLFESGLSSECDTIWVSDSSQELQINRLVYGRGMDRSSAQERILAQPPQSLKNNMADAVINNHGSYLQTWRQVRQAWREILQSSRIQLYPDNPAKFNGTEIYRCNPDDAEKILKLISRFSEGSKELYNTEANSFLFNMHYLIYSAHSTEQALIAWESDNFVIRVSEFFYREEKHTTELLYNIIKELDQFWPRYNPELILLRPPVKLEKNTRKLQQLGYEEIQPGEGLFNGDWFRIPEGNNAAIWLAKKLGQMSNLS